MLLAVLVVKTVNLAQVATAFDSKACIDSRYKRLRRFLAHFTIDFDSIAKFIFLLFFKSDDKLYITMDRTIWFWGKEKVNIFVLAIAYENIAIPLLWEVLDRACPN